MSFWTGVAVSRSMYFFERPATNRQFTLRRFFSRWASHLLQDAQARPLLVRITGDAMEGRPGEEPVESVDEGEAMRLAVQMPRPRSVPRRAEGAGEQVRIGFVELQGEGHIRGRMGLPDREGHRGGIPSPATAGGHETARTILTVAPIRPGRRELWNDRTPSTGDGKAFAVRFDDGSNKAEADARKSNEHPESG